MATPCIHYFLNTMIGLFPLSPVPELGEHFLFLISENAKVKKKEKSIVRFQNDPQFSIYICIFFFLVPDIPTLSLIRNLFVSFLR
jgi:hypothetical protein